MLLSNFIELFLSSAPWLLLGLIIAGLLKEFVPMAWMQKQLGAPGFKSTLKAALLGAPLPLCSCGVIPAAISLRRSGASKAATTSFLVSTPETGVDSVVLSYVLLGPFMAIVRPISAVTSAIVAGLLVGRDEEKDPSNSGNNPIKDECCSSAESKAAKASTASSCCSSEKPKQVETSHCCSSAESKAAKITKVTKTSTASSCCSSEKPKQVETSHCCSSAESKAAKITKTSTASSCCSSEEPKQIEVSGCGSSNPSEAKTEQKGIMTRIVRGVRFAATDLMKDTTVWLLGGLFFAALIQTYVPSDFMAAWGDGVLAMLVMVVISIPMYICATASTPIAAGLLLSGVSPGAILVFMLAGPATNIATLGVVANELGKRALFGYLTGVLGVALIAGVIVNYLVGHFELMVMPQIHEHGELLPDVLTYSTGVIIMLLMLRIIFNKLNAKLRA